MRSDRCGLDELFLEFGIGEAERGCLALGPDWLRLSLEKRWVWAVAPGHGKRGAPHGTGQLRIAVVSRVNWRWPISL